ncbi:MAG: tetratricopeptide repeat protein [Ignavibacteriales bacterium]|nr:tetratricopeptide repeat protein [Ignavibacteriales bacterium]
MAGVRKLASIVFTDIVGYTAQMAKDETFGLELLRKNRELVHPLAEKYNGRVLKELGDGTLLSFESSESAVLFAIEVQQTLSRTKVFTLRIGIHSGEVVFEHNDVFGDGVNIAARVQPFAIPGGICVTKKVLEQNPYASDESVISIGPQKLKGVPKPFNLFHIKADGVQVPKPHQRLAAMRSVRWSATLLFLLLFSFAGYLLLPLFNPFGSSSIPSLAILQLKNLGGKEDDPRSYGILQDLITDFTNMGGVQVVPALEITIPAVGLRDLAKQLQVRYLFQGTYNHTGESLFVTANIFDAKENKNLWAERIIIHSLQLSTLPKKFRDGILAKLNITQPQTVTTSIAKLPTENAEAYELYVQAQYRLEKATSNRDYLTARDLFLRALTLDPNFIRAKVGVGKTYQKELLFDTARSLYQEALSLSRAADKKAEQPTILKSIGILYYEEEDNEQAINYYEQALKLAREFKNTLEEAWLLNNIALIYAEARDTTKALQHYSDSKKIFQKLNYFSGEAVILNNVGNLYLSVGNYAGALTNFEQALVLHQKAENKEREANTLNNIGNIYLELGEYQKAKVLLEKSIALNTDLGLVKQLAENYYSMGIVLSGDSRWSEAKEYYTKSLTAAEKFEDEYQIGYAYYGFGTISLAENNLPAAINYFEKSTSHFAISGDVEFAPLSYLALLKAKEGKLDSSRLLAEQIANQVSSIPEGQGEITVFRNLSQTYSLLDDSEKFRKYLDRARVEIEFRSARITAAGLLSSYRTKVKINNEVLLAWDKLNKKL